MPSGDFSRKLSSRSLILSLFMSSMKQYKSETRASTAERQILTLLNLVLTDVIGSFNSSHQLQLLLRLAEDKQR